MFFQKKRKISKKKLKRYKKIANRFKLKFRNKKRRIKGYKLKMLKFFMKLRGPDGNARNVGESLLRRQKKKEDKTLKTRFLSTQISLNLFKVTYNVLLNYHSPLGKRKGEWKRGVMLTNIFMIRNKMSILDLTTIFFELRKMVNRLFKALKLRKGVALLNGRRYGWKKIFTFIFEKWLPGFFTNFYLNITEIIGYFIKRRFLTRRQKARVLSLKALCLDKSYLGSFRRKNKNRMKKESKLINFLKLPSVSLSLIDNSYWLRECQKEGITAIQVVDSNSEIEKIDYPIISNQQSIAFLSFITLLAKEVAYQARYWEITRFKKVTNSYAMNSRIKDNDLVNNVVEDYFWWQDKIRRYNKLLSLGYKVGKKFKEFSKTKILDRTYLIDVELKERKKFKKLDEKINEVTFGYSLRKKRVIELLLQKKNEQ